MIKRKIPAFDLHKICNSGQCFRMKSLGENRYGLTAFGEYLEMEQEGEVISFSCTGEEFSSHICCHIYFPPSSFPATQMTTLAVALPMSFKIFSPVCMIKSSCF